MGGIVFVLAAVTGYFLSHVRLWRPTTGLTFDLEPLDPGGLLAIFALLGMATVGLVDDYLKVSNRRSLGLGKAPKFLGQLVVAGIFAYSATTAGISTQISFVRPLGVDLGVFFVVLVLVMLTGAANGVNLADGMDGLASGSGALVIGAYTIIAFWQWRNPDFYNAVDPLDLAIVAAAMFGALLGFLWWNAAPAQIIMGDVGSEGIGGVIAALALLTDTHLLLVVLGGIYVAETLSVIIQVAVFKATGKRVFRMAPIHHHFDLAGWPETTVVVRFWILTGVGVALGLGFFYADFISTGGLLR